MDVGMLPYCHHVTWERRVIMRSSLSKSQNTWAGLQYGHEWHCIALYSQCGRDFLEGNSCGSAVKAEGGHPSNSVGCLKSNHGNVRTCMSDLVTTCGSGGGGDVACPRAVANGAEFINTGNQTRPIHRAGKSYHFLGVREC